jgi:UDP-N-acetylmuramoyl-tripeptide--D-alanyl-D-alanine ligase
MAFNANPTSLTAALPLRPRRTTMLHHKGRRVAILGDMLELGPHENAMHAETANDPSIPALHLIHALALACATSMMRCRTTCARLKRRTPLRGRRAKLVDGGDVAVKAQRDQNQPCR